MTFVAPSNRLRAVILGLILVVGFGLRLIAFPHYPSGLNQDEISAGYESYSLLQTGADRWGYRLPVYFLGWGSGQNVLQSYLSIPAIALWGLTPIAVRAVPMLLGLLTLPLFYFASRHTYGEIAALFGTFILAVCPWHVMLSRWGLESNLLPFFLLLGIFTFRKAVDSRLPWRIVTSLIPFALALYAYGISIVVVGVLFLFLLMTHAEEIRPQWKQYLTATIIFSTIACPFGFFLVKNYVTRTNYAFERHLPISVPLLPESRLEQTNTGLTLRNVGHLIRINARFIAKGLTDDLAWNHVRGITTLPALALILALYGAYVELRGVVRERKKPSDFLLWAAACIPLLLIIQVNTNRINAIYLPLVALAGFGCSRMLDIPFVQRRRGAFVAVVLGAFFAVSALFVTRYFSPQYAATIADNFNPGLSAALKRAESQERPDRPVLITDNLALNYVQTLFYLKVDPERFQRSGATWKHPDFGQFHFEPQSSERLTRPYTFLVRESDRPPCKSRRHVSHINHFIIGECLMRLG